MKHHTYEGKLQVQVMLPDLKHIRNSKHHNSKQYTYRKRRPKQHHRDTK